ncbi:MAG: hypothetical protein ABFS42_02145 [Candidatus Krumholzibacteriota bacterium]
MRDRRDPWKWPFSIGLTLVVFLGAVFLLPQPWIDAFFSPLSLQEGRQRDPASPWLVILPPPTIETVPDFEPEVPDQRPEPYLDEIHHDPDWWSRSWVIRPVEKSPATGSAAVPDSVAMLLAALGVERDFITRARPDSVLAARLFILQVEDSFNFDELKPYLRAMGRSRDYADILSRAADMYDDFLATEIMTPD